MHIALDVSALDPEFRAHAVRGTGRYVSELYSGFLNKIEASQESQLSTFRYTDLGKGTFLDSCIDYLPAGKMMLRHQVAYPLSITKDSVNHADLLHFPVHADAPAWSKQPFVVTVLDLIPLIFKDLYAPKINNARFRFARWLELQSIKNAKHILAISECTARDVHRLLGVPRDKISVTYLGVCDTFFDQKRNILNEKELEELGIDPDRPIVLYVGGIDQRKNISFLLESFSDVLYHCHEKKKPLPQLVMAGKIQDDLQYVNFSHNVRRLDIADSIVETGYLSDELLKKLYSSADLFFYPSLYEGFGLPVLEAMASGLPVACSNTSSLPEVAGDAALLFDPSDKAQAVRSVLSGLFDSSLRDTLVDTGRSRAKRFNWESTITSTLGGYQKALNLLDSTPASSSNRAFL